LRTVAVFVVVFAIGAVVSAAATDEMTVCPPIQEGDAFHVRITLWPPAALKCTIEHREGGVTTDTTLPWWEWICVAACALGVAIFRLSVPRALASVGLVLIGLAGWFLGGPT
jgi:hypothetical protein